jgi:hypothetical protein
LALAAIYDGASRTEAAKIGRVTLQIVRDWVVKFNANGRTEEIGRERKCRSRRHRNLVRRRGARRPEEQDHPPVGRARHAPERPQRPAHRFGLHLRRDLPKARQRRRAHHAALRHRGDEPAPGRNRSRPAPPRRCSSIKPAGISRAGSFVPLNITIIPLPAKCPELNPQENLWQFMRHNWLSNRVLKSYDAIVDDCWDAWNKLIDQPWRIMSLGPRNWASEF